MTTPALRSNLLVVEATESYLPGFKQAPLDRVRALADSVGWTAQLTVVLAAQRMETT